MPNDSHIDSIAANTIAKWKETYELSFELADVTFTILNEFMDYCKTHNIPFNKEKGIWNLVLKARSIFREIEELNAPISNVGKLLADGFLQRKRDSQGLDRTFKEKLATIK